MDQKAGQLAERLLRLVILDKLGYLPFSPSGGARLYLLVWPNGSSLRRFNYVHHGKHRTSRITPSEELNI